MCDQLANVSAAQFFAECRHASFALTHNSNQAARARDVGMLAPPIRIPEIGCFVRVSQRRVAGAIHPMTPGTIVSEKIGDPCATGFGC